MRNELGYSPKWSTAEAFDDYVRGRGLTPIIDPRWVRSMESRAKSAAQRGDVEHRLEIGWGEGTDVAGESKAKVIPLHSNTGRQAAQRRAAAVAKVRADIALLSDPRAVRRPSRSPPWSARSTSAAPAQRVRRADESPNELAKRIAAVAEFVRKRMMGDYTVDEFGFDQHLNDSVFLPLLRVFFNSWFRVEVSGIENLPETGAALIVANHAGVLPFDGLMASVAVHDNNPHTGTSGCWPPTWRSTCR